MALTFDNPVVTKEFRSRMRGARAYWLLFGYLLLLSLVLFCTYVSWWNGRANADPIGSPAAFTVGCTFFFALFYCQAILVTLITPALTAGALSIEREQRTYEMLRSTTIRPREIVLGKLFSSVSFIVLLLTSSLPLVSLCFLLGGVSPAEVFWAYALLVCDAFLFGAIGLAWSAHAANTVTATALSYATLFGFFAVTAPFVLLLSGHSQFSSGLAALNPLDAVSAAVATEHYYRWTCPAWLPALLLNGSLGVLAVLASINRLDDFPARRALPLRLGALGVLGLALFFGNGAVVGNAIPTDSWRPIWERLSDIALAAVLLFVPIFATGDPAESPAEGVGRAGLLAGWRHALSRAALPSALPMALLLAGVTLAFFGCAAVPLAAAMAGSWGSSTALPSALLVLSVTLGVSGLGYLLSVLMGNRWSALTVLALTLVLVMALPYFSFATMSATDAQHVGGGPAVSSAVNFLYLCPFPALWQIGDIPSQFGPGFASDVPAAVSLAGYDLVPMWVVTGGIYLLLSLLSYAIARAILRRRRHAAPDSLKTA